MSPLEELREIAREFPSLAACSLVLTADAVRASDGALKLAVELAEAGLSVNALQDLQRRRAA